MNEVTQIHLGRQAYTIANDAHSALRAYLAAIEKAVGDHDVVDEVEARMVELLTEHGVNSDKVILLKDVNFLKKQLGDPKDFSDEEPEEASEFGSKRLFRDTDNAMIAGVAAGLANYLGLNVVLVRLAMILLIVFSFGGAVLLYILLWIIVPPATTASEKLQMRGMSVTLEAIKGTVSKADVTGTARRVNRSALMIVDKILRIILKLIGLGFMLLGLLTLVGTAFTRIYMSLHDGRLFQENLFPIGAREQLLVWIAMGVAFLLSLFMIVTGIAIFRRKWPINGWVTGVLATVFLTGAVFAAALTADAAPRVNQRYQAMLHTTAVQNIQPFTKIQTMGDIDISYISSPTYGANIHYAGHPDLSKVKVYVANSTLYVDSRQLDRINHCDMLCLYPRYDMTVDIYAPNIQSIKTPPNTDIFYPKGPAPVLAPVKP